MQIDVILGLQWGDEGKGKIVDFLAENYDVVARFQGGPNAGHTLKFDGKKFVLHTVPSGIFRKDIVNLIGNGVVIDPVVLMREVQQLADAGFAVGNRLLIAQKAHLILPTHRLLDAASEVQKGEAKIGSTLKGIGPTYMDKTGRNGLRVGDIFSPKFKEKYEALKNKHLQLMSIYPSIDFNLQIEEERWFEAIEKIKLLPSVDCTYYLNEALRRGQRVLAEGAQGSMLDVDFGTYPFVTSSNTISAGVCTGLGVAPQLIGRVIGITKAYCTRVGSGPFPTELEDDMGDYLRTAGGEFGSTTGRPRRCGWIDLPQLLYTVMINGVTEICMTKIDVLNTFSTIRAATHYFDFSGNITQNLPFELDDIRPKYEAFNGWNSDLDQAYTWNALPKEIQKYITYIEKYLQVPVTYISTGPEREKLIVRS